MTVPQIVLAELRRLLATRMARVALVALCTVPLLYAGLYLWANQDPQGNLDDVPVALVVDDDGAMSADGTVRVIGDEVADELVADASFGWHRVSAAGAKAGVADGTYDFSVTLPSSFTADLESVASDDPRQATVILETNDANGYIATSLGSSASTALLDAVTAKVGKEAASQLLLSISQIRDGLVDASSGAGSLADGAHTAHEGSTSLVEGTGKVADGAHSLATGTADLAAGADRLAGGATTLDAGLATLSARTATLDADTAALASGAQQVADGNARVAAVGQDLADATGSLAGGTAQTRAAIVARLQAAGLSDAQIADAIAPLDQLGNAIVDGNAQVQQASAQLVQLSDGADRVASGAAALAAAAPALTDGIDEAASGASELATGAETLDAGAASAASGAEQLAAGAGAAHDGAVQLDAGLAQLDDGAAQLSTSLADAVDQIPASTDELRAQQASTISDPVRLDTDSVASAGSYGEGLAPFFLSLAAWIGIYALMLVVRPISRRAVTALHSPVRVGIASWLSPALLGLVQMVALFGIVTLALGFSLSWPWAVLGIMLLASATFAAIIVALNVWLGSTGQFLGLILMVAQLVSAGGTFPWQTLPGPLAVLHHSLPMTYAVEAMRQAMYGGSVTLAVQDAAVLAAFGLGGVLLCILGVARMMNHRTMRDLQPSLLG